MRRCASATIALVLPTATALAEAPMAARQTLVIKPLMSADRNSADQPIVFPHRNGHVTAAVFEIAPGTTLAVHKHPFPRIGYVLAGTLRVTNVEQGSSAIYRSGDFVLEAVDVWHKGENIGPNVLRLLVIDLSEKGVPTTVSRDTGDGQTQPGQSPAETTRKR